MTENSSSGELPDVDTIPEVLSLRDEGFVPILEVTGSVELGEVWPADHCRTVRDTRYAAEPDGFAGVTDGRLFLVRSPWPGFDLEVVLRLLYRWWRRHEPADQLAYEIPAGQRLRLAEQFLSQDEKWVRAFQRGTTRPLK